MPIQEKADNMNDRIEGEKPFVVCKEPHFLYKKAHILQILRSWHVSGPGRILNAFAMRIKAPAGDFALLIHHRVEDARIL